jgi:6-pyruvoyltetrahydropterin/6-carboxytetrahydropterin synthase
MITCSRRIQFCAGHRVYKHESKCAHPHGHNYVALIEAQHAGITDLDSLGRVIDFSVLKDRVGGWIERYWDHGFIHHIDDKDMYNGLRAVGHDVKRFGMIKNPTAENMADFLLRNICPRVLEGTGVTVVKVTLWETENCFAVASL